MRHPRVALVLTSVVILGATMRPLAAQTAPARAALPPVTLTAAQDHQRLMDLLHMTSIRPGRNGSNPQAADFANYDESKATPFPDLPDPLTMKDGTKVTTAAQWPPRRAEIVEDFDREIYGRVPKETPKVTWEITNTQKNGATITRTLVGHVDNSAYPAITVNIQASVTVPANAGGPVPVILQLSAGGGGFGGGARGGGAGAPRGGAGAGGPGRGGAGGGPGGVPPGAPAGGRGAAPGGAMLPMDDQGLFFVAAPTGPAAGGAPGGGGAAAGRAGFGGAGAGGRGFGGAGAGGPGGGPSWQQQLLAKGWGYATINTGSVQADNGAGLTQGIIGLCNKGQPRGLEDWGVLRAWAWGCSRVLDCFEQHPEIGVDPKQVGLEGHSRWGKGTVVAMAYDPRFAIAYVSSSGEGGAHINRRNFGEIIENVAGSGEYHWMAGNFLKYAGLLTGKDLPVDGHELVALCAPRPVFISGGNMAPTNNDSWQDPKGMYIAARDAGPVYVLLGKKDLGAADDKGVHVSSKEFPPIETPLLDGDVAYREHTGGHTDVPNWPTFITFADRYLKAPKPAAPATAPAAQ